jgi:signal transduction histidine kinase
VEILRNEPSINPEIVVELKKDIQRLETITTRFSNIGSTPILNEEDLEDLIFSFINYLKIRISTKVYIEIKSSLAAGQLANVNKYLFEWVIENVCKNAVDAMGGTGNMLIYLHEGKNNTLLIDISDTGKGIIPANMSKIFNPGYSTKKRGWGLGLTLAKRIVENYHQGKLTLKSTEINKGSTFRISLPKPTTKEV